MSSFALQPSSSTTNPVYGVVELLVATKLAEEERRSTGRLPSLIVGDEEGWIERGGREIRGTGDSR